MAKEEFLVGDIVKINKSILGRNTKKYIVIALADNKEFAWIEAPKDKKFRLIKVATSKLKLVNRSQLKMI